MSRPAMIIHGGAWDIPANLTDATIAGVKAAAIKGYEIMKNGGSALDAVQAAVVVMEDDPVYKAGTGSALNSEGEVELDAIIMEGSNLNTGAVACVQNIKNPVSLARLVMEKTEHTLLVGKGANIFASEMGIPEVPSDTLVTKEAKEELENFLKFRTTVQTNFKQRQPVSGCDTVGACAVDAEGNMAFATSTGGTTAKRPGRVGDSPLIGCGGYADNDIGAVSSTGDGESITKVCLSLKALGLVERGKSVQGSLEEALSYMARRVGGSGGLIMVSKEGDFGMYFTTKRMSWASLKDGTLKYGIDVGDEYSEQIGI